MTEGQLVQKTNWVDRAVLVAVAMAVVKLLLHLATNGNYGYFRDELYFLDCGRHLDWGYPDHAPLIGLVAWFSRTVFGESLPAIRLLPALAGSIMVLLAGLLTRAFGGRAFAVFLACLCVITAPVYLVKDTLLSMNAFEPLLWTGCAWLAWRATTSGSPRLWLWAGVLAGVGLENKHSMAFFLAALAVAIIASPQRRVLRSCWPWIGLGITGLLFLPNLIWQYRHDWATLELLRNVQRMHKNIELAPWAFVGQQILLMLPPAGLVWAAGLWWCLRRGAKQFRMLGWLFLGLLGLMIALKGKVYYLTPIYPILFAAGAVWWQEKIRQRRWLGIVLTGLITASGIVFAPMFLPILPVHQMIAYQRTLGFQPPKTEVAHAGPLPQYFGDMFGWPEMVKTVAQVYWALPPADRAQAVIFAGNYGEAGAIDFFGRRYGLPKAISVHQAYYFWGPRDATGDVVILLQSDRGSAERGFARVETAAHVGHRYAMAEEHFDILIGRGLKWPIKEIWPRLKHWN